MDELKELRECIINLLLKEDRRFIKQEFIKVQDNEKLEIAIRIAMIKYLRLKERV